MNKQYKISTIKEKLGKLAVFLIAFDSFPFFIGGSIYRPVSVFPMLLYFIFLVYEKVLNSSIKKNDFYLFFLFIMMLVISFMKGLYYSDFEGVIDFFLTGTLGYVTYVSFSDFLSIQYKSCLSKDEFFSKIGFLYLKAMIIPFLFGGLQIIQILLHRQIGFFSFLFSLVTYRFENGRVFLVCGEPSWAVLYLIVLLCILSSIKNFRFKRIIIFYCLILILFTFSMLGFMTIIIAILLFGLFYLIKNPEKIRFLLIFILFAIITLFILDIFLTKLVSNDYLKNRYLQIKELFFLVFDLKNLYIFIQITDNSLFIRFVNPVIAMIIAFQHPLFGVGGGYYYKYYPDIIMKYFPLSVNLVEVKAALTANYHTSSKNFFCRLFAECGIFIGISVLLLFVRKLKRINKKDYKGLLLLTMLFTVVFNFDSLCYILFIFILVFFNVYSLENKR